MIVYFSGTGNSRYSAQVLANRLGDTLTDAFPFIREGKTAALTSERPWVFVSPTYAWRVPRVFADFIRSGRFSGSREAYFVMTCGDETGNADAFNRALCREKGLTCRGTLPVVMPENYIALYDAPEEAAAKKMVEDAVPHLEQGAACIRENRDFPAQKTGAADRLKSGVVNAAFYRFIVKATKFTVSDVCTGCGQCVRRCVLNNIELRDKKPVWGSRCTHCMACICSCPTAAIEYGKASVGKPRYQCPACQAPEER